MPTTDGVKGTSGTGDIYWPDPEDLDGFFDAFSLAPELPDHPAEAGIGAC